MVQFYCVCTQSIAFWLINYTEISKHLFLEVKLSFFHLQTQSHFKAGNTFILTGTPVPASREGKRPKYIHGPRAASLPVMQGLKMGLFTHRKWWPRLNENQAYYFCHRNKAAKLTMNLSLQIWYHCLPSTHLPGISSVQTPFPGAAAIVPEHFSKQLSSHEWGVLLPALYTGETGCGETEWLAQSHAGQVWVPDC